MTFTLDTSGTIHFAPRYAKLRGFRTFYRWPDLSPFAQGYVEALFASPRLFHMECPSCEWDCIVGPPGLGDLGLCCPICAEDNGRDVTLRTVKSDLPATVEGNDARADILRFDRLSPEALAMILSDCERFRRQYVLPHYDGAAHWRERQTGDLAPYFPPLTVYLGDDGRVRLKAKGDPS